MNNSTLATSSIQGRRVPYLVFATIALLILGLIYAWSIFARPIGASFPEYGPLLPQVFQVSMFAFCLSAIPGSQIFGKVSPRAAIIVAAVLLGIGFFATSFLASWGIWVLFVFYGLFAGSGVGIGYNAIISLVNPWFPDKTGLCSGVMMMGFGISSLVFGSMANAAFAIVDWTIVFIIVAVVGVVLLLAVAFVIKPAPRDFAAQLGLRGAVAATKESPTQGENIFKTKGFWLFSTWLSIVVACCLALIGSSAQGAAVFGYDANFGALLVGLVATMNGISRIANGAIFDKFGILVVMRVNAFVTTLCMLGLAVSYSLAGQGVSPVLYVIAAILVAYPYGSAPVMAAAFVRQRFGQASFAKNLGIVGCNIAVGSVINMVIGAVFGAPFAGNGVTIFGILTGLGIVAFIAAFAFGGTHNSDLAKISTELQ